MENFIFRYREGKYITFFRVLLKEFTKFEEAQIKHLGRNFKMDGFRPGKIPVNILQEYYGEEARTKAMMHFVTPKLFDFHAEIGLEYDYLNNMPPCKIGLWILFPVLFPLGKTANSKAEASTIAHIESLILKQDEEVRSNPERAAAYVIDEQFRKVFDEEIKKAGFLDYEQMIEHVNTEVCDHHGHVHSEACAHGLESSDATLQNDTQVQSVDKTKENTELTTDQTSLDEALAEIKKDHFVFKENLILNEDLDLESLLVDVKYEVDENLSEIDKFILHTSNNSPKFYSKTINNPEALSDYGDIVNISLEVSQTQNVSNTAKKDLQQVLCKELCEDSLNLMLGLFNQSHLQKLHRELMGLKEGESKSFSYKLPRLEVKSSALGKKIKVSNQSPFEAYAEQELHFKVKVNSIKTSDDGNIPAMIEKLKLLYQNDGAKVLKFIELLSAF